MKYKGLIFDFNGVLWWDTEIQELAWQETAKNLRGQEFSREELKEHLHGRNNKYTLEYLLGKKIINKDDLNELTQLKESKYRKKCIDLGEDFKLSPGAIQLLDYLKKFEVQITIATASEITNLEFFFKHLNLSNWFDFEKIIYDDGSRPGKPDPKIYLDAAKIINRSPSECVVVEDAKSGMQAAEAAKIGYLIALGPKQKHTELLKHRGVKRVIETLDEIVQLNLF